MSWGPSQNKDASYQYKDPMLKIRRSHGRFILNIEIPRTRKNGLYIGSVWPRAMALLYFTSAKPWRNAANDEQFASMSRCTAHVSVISAHIFVPRVSKRTLTWFGNFSLFQTQTQTILFSINTVNIHKRRRDNIKVFIYFYGAHAILIVNIAEYLCMETSTKVSSEPLSWKPPWEEV